MLPCCCCEAAGARLRIRRVSNNFPSEYFIVKDGLTNLANLFQKKSLNRREIRPKYQFFGLLYFLIHLTETFFSFKDRHRGSALTLAMKHFKLWHLLF